MSAGGEERMWSLKRIGDSGSEPELEGEPSTRDEIEHVERGHKRQTVQTPATTRHSTRSLVRQTRRLLTAAAQRSATGNAADAGAVVGSSMILSQMPAELLETVLSCEFFPNAHNIFCFSK